MTRPLGATLVSATTAAVLVVGTSMATNEGGHVVGGFATATWAGSSLSLVLFVSAVSVLYSAYLQMNKVHPGLSGSAAAKAQIHTGGKASVEGGISWLAGVLSDVPDRLHTS